MAKKRSKPNTELSAKAVAKAEISAKASYEHKKTVSEVIPPDVTRAKAGAWLDLLSPITEWAGMRGDALRRRRAQLRIQQEDVLNSLARSVSHKLAQRKIVGPVPTKILVPLLEKASLEQSSDAYMVDKWAELLASAATQSDVPPRFVGILAEMSGSQAQLLEEILFKNKESAIHQENRDWIVCELDVPYLQRFFSVGLGKKKEAYPSLSGEVTALLRCRGLMLLSYSEGMKQAESRMARKFFSIAESIGTDLDVLRSLNLIELKRFHFELATTRYELSYYQITDGGLKLLSLCSERARELLLEFASDNSGKYFPASI